MKKLFWLRLLLIAVVMTVCTTAYAEDPYGFYYNEYVKPTDTLNVRSGAGTSYSVVGTVLIGHIGKVIGGPTYNNGYQWWYITWPVQGFSGWSIQNYLTLYNERAEADYSTGYIEVNNEGSGNLNTRSAPGLDQVVLNSYAVGTVGEVIGGPTQLHGFVWWRVVWPDYTIGWSVQRYMDETEQPVTTTSATIYAGAYGYGWDSWSWGINPPYSSSNILEVTYIEQYGGLYLHTNTFDTDDYETLRFMIYGGTNGGQNPTVAVRDASGNNIQQLQITDYVSGNTLLGDTWHAVVIPLSDLGANNRTITGVVIQSSVGTTLYFKEMEFSDVSGSTYDGGTTPQNDSATVFAEVYGNGWDSWSWGANPLIMTAKVYSGSYGLNVIYSEQYGGLYLHTNSFETNNYETLRFMIYGGVNGGQNPTVVVRDANGNNIQELQVTEYVSGNTLLGDTWHSVVIPLADLNAVNTTITGLVIQSPTETVMVFDEIEFSDVSGSTYDGGTMPNVSAMIYAEALGNGWGDWSWSTTLNPSSTTHYSGSTGLEITFQSPYAGLMLGSSGFDTTGYNSLTFFVNGGDAGGQKLRVRLYDENNVELVQQELKTYIVGGFIIPHAWHEIRIPLSDLNGENRIITSVVIQSEEAGIITIDDLTFKSLSDNDTGVCNE